MLKLPKPWLVWILGLIIVNMVGPMLFFSTLEAKIVLAAFMLGAVLQTAIFSAKGFVRLLGLGHVAWIPLVVWLWSRLESGSPEGLFSYWLICTVVLNSVSLVIDVADVIRYIKGERAPQIEA